MHLLKNYYPAKFQWSALQIGQDSSIYVLDIILDFDLLSLLLVVI